MDGIRTEADRIARSDDASQTSRQLIVVGETTTMSATALDEQITSGHIGGEYSSHP